MQMIIVQQGYMGYFWDQWIRVAKNSNCWGYFRHFWDQIFLFAVGCMEENYAEEVQTFG